MEIKMKEDYKSLSTPELKLLLQTKKKELSLKRNSGGSVKKAQKLIDKLFVKFKKGGEFITDTIETARQKCIAVSPTGRVRHLWGHLHFDKSVKESMDRRGPNSAIQGMSSDEGFTGGRELQVLMWEIFEKETDTEYPMRQFLSVHDSNECMSKITVLPISLYLIEHALTTRVHKKYREVHGFEMDIDLEIEMEIGGSGDNLTKWDFRNDTLLKIAENQIDYMNKEFDYNLNKEKIMETVKHNADIIYNIRKEEVKLAMESNKSYERVLLLERPNIVKELIWQ